jgi:hypothetical protein
MNETTWIVQHKFSENGKWFVDGEYKDENNANKCYSDLCHDNPEYENKNMLQLVKKEIIFTVVASH